MTKENENRFEEWFVRLAKKYKVSTCDLELLIKAGLVNVIDGEAYRTNKPYEGKAFAIPLVRMKHISTVQ